MKVLWITGRYFGNDLCQTTQIELASALKRCGNEVSFLAPANESGISMIEAEGLSIHQVKISAISGLKSISFDKQVRKILPKLLQKQKFGLAICSWRGVMGAAHILDSQNIPWILIDRGPPAYSGILARLQWRYYDKAFKRHANSASAIFTVSEGHADFVKNRFSLQKKPMLIPAGVNPENFNHKNMNKSKITSLIYHGRLDASRNILKLVEIGDLLNKDGAEFKMFLVGEGDLMNKLVKISSKKNWLDVTPPVSRDKIAELLITKHIGLLPMDSRMVWKTSSPLKLYEYGAAGLAMVGINHAGHRLQGEHNFQRLVSEENMIEEMVSAIKQLISENLTEIGMEAKEYIMKNNTWDHSAAQLNATIQELVS